MEKLVFTHFCILIKPLLTVYFKAITVLTRNYAPFLLIRFSYKIISHFSMEHLYRELYSYSIITK